MTNPPTPVRLTLEQELVVEEWRKYAHAFGQADWTPPGFADRMEAVGFYELREVTEDDIAESFAYERGIELGGSVYDPTAAGIAALTNKDTEK